MHPPTAGTLIVIEYGMPCIGFFLGEIEQINTQGTTIMFR